MEGRRAAGEQGRPLLAPGQRGEGGLLRGPGPARSLPAARPCASCRRSQPRRPAHPFSSAYMVADARRRGPFDVALCRLCLRQARLGRSTGARARATGTDPSSQRQPPAPDRRTQALGPGILAGSVDALARRAHKEDEGPALALSRLAHGLRKAARELAGESLLDGSVSYYCEPGGREGESEGSKGAAAGVSAGALEVGEGEETTTRTHRCLGGGPTCRP